MKTSKVMFALPLLELGLAFQVLFVFMVYNIHELVQTLYGDSLQFSGFWVVPYWNILSSLIILLVVGAVFILVLSIRFIQFLRGRASLKYADSLISFSILGLNGCSYYFFTRLEYIIHHDLYSYGFQPSQQWLSSYAQNAGPGLVFLVLATVLVMVVPLALFLVKKIEKTELRVRMGEGIQKSRVDVPRMVSYTLIGAGAGGLVASFVFSSAIVVFVGLGLLLWGVLLAYVRTEDYAKRTVLEAVADSRRDAVFELIKTLGYRGVPVFLPPRYLRNLTTCRMFISKFEGAGVPTPEQIRSAGPGLITAEPYGMLIHPVGFELARLFKKTLGARFKGWNIEYLRRNIPKILVEKLELVQEVGIEVEEKSVKVRMVDASFGRLKSESGNSSKSTFGDTIASAIACIIAEATDNPVVIDKQEMVEGVNEEVYWFWIVDEVQS